MFQFASKVCIFFSSVCFRETNRDRGKGCLKCLCVIKRGKEERSAWAELFMFIHSTADLFTGLATICSRLPFLPFCLFLPLSFLFLWSSSLLLSYQVLLFHSIAQLQSKWPSIISGFLVSQTLFDCCFHSLSHTHTGVGSSIGGQVLQSLHTHTHTDFKSESWLVKSWLCKTTKCTLTWTRTATSKVVITGDTAIWIIIMWFLSTLWSQCCSNIALNNMIFLSFSITVHSSEVQRCRKKRL